MKENLKNILYSISPNVLDILLIICLIAVTVLFVVLIILSKTVIDYDFSKKYWFLGSNCGIILLCLCGYLILDANLSPTLLLLGVSVIYLSIGLFIKPKKILVKQEHRELINLTDKIISKDGDREIKKAVDIGANNLAVQEQTDKKPSNDIDYAHIKSIIERLSYFSLSSVDKRQLSQLEFNLLQAEKGEGGLELKQNINDGLSALLKIMSKYGA